MLSEQEYIDYYAQKGRCIDDSFKRKNSLNTKQLHSRYEKYIKRNSKERKRAIEDDRWNAVKKGLPKECELIARLTLEKRFKEIAVLKENGKQLVYTIDPAHIFSRGSYPELKYDPLNVVSLNRFSHSMLDTYHHPIFGFPINKEEHSIWWEYIRGEEKFKELKSKL